MKRIGIIGAGAWGTALAQIAALAGNKTVIWAREKEVVNSINRERENRLFLPGITLDANIRATADSAEAAEADAILLTAPAQFMRTVTAEIADAVGADTKVVLCAKGIERDTLASMTEIAGATLPGRKLAVLSGPTFAAEVARGLPTAVTLATADRATGEAIASAIGGSHFRIYLSDDPIGAEIGGAVKNVLAIACGIIQGRGFGDNARAAIITRGLAEMARLSVARGGRAETMMGLAGLGDLTLTCNSTQSRNFSLGVALGEGDRLDDILGRRNSVAEGVYSADAVVRLAAKLNIEMPISAAVDAVINRGRSVEAAITGLLSRPAGEELA